MNKFFLQVGEDNIITDCVTYPYEDYIEYNGTIPHDILGRWHRYIDGAIVEDISLKPIDEPSEINRLKQQVQIMQLALDELLLGGM